MEKKLDDQKEDIQELTEQLEEVKEKLERRQETQKAATADNPSRRERKWCDDEHVRCPTESHRVAQSPTEPHRASRSPIASATDSEMDIQHTF